MKDKQKSSRTAAKASSGFTAEERAAMRERARETKKGAADGEGDVLAKIATMKEPDRSMAERVHALIRATAPELAPRTWYGMPAYSKNGNVVCFFQDAGKFKSRYAMLGFSDKANLDDGEMWPVYWALRKLTAADEAKIKKIIKQAVS